MKELHVAGSSCQLQMTNIEEEFDRICVEFILIEIELLIVLVHESVRNNSVCLGLGLALPTLARALDI